MSVRQVMIALLAVSGVATAIACSSFSGNEAAASDAATEGSSPVQGGDADARDAASSATACAETIPDASSDGAPTTEEVVCGSARVFLTTSTDHCGACFRACANCANGVCQPVPVVRDPGDAGLYVDIAGVSSGVLTYLRSAKFYNVELVAVAADGTGTTNTIVRSDGGAPADVLSTHDTTYLPQYYHGNVVVARTSAVYATAGNQEQGVIAMTAADGGVFLTIADRVEFIGEDARREVRFQNRVGPQQVWADDRTLYWTESDPDGGGGSLQIEDLAARDHSSTAIDGRPTAITGDGDYVFVFEESRQQLLRFDRADPRRAPIVLGTWTGDAATATRLLLRGGFAYARLLRAGSAHGDIVRFPRCGGAPLSLIHADELPLFAADDAFVYVSATDGYGVSTISRIER